MSQEIMNLKDKQQRFILKKSKHCNHLNYMSRFNESSNDFRLSRCIETEWWEVNET